MIGRATPNRVSTTRLARAFTLVEVVVTIAIVGVLAGLLVPAIRVVHGESMSISCRSNLRQMGAAAISYASMHDGTMPAAVVYEVHDGALVTRAWDVEQHADGTVVPGPLWNFLGGPTSVQQCPSFDGPSTFGADPYTGYNYNTTYVGTEGRLPTFGPGGTILQGWEHARLGSRTATHRFTDRVALFGDAGWSGGANKFMRAPSNVVEGDLGQVYAGAQAFRHRCGCNVVHLDGHVGCRIDPLEGMHATPSLLEDVMRFPDNGFLSNDDSAYAPW